LSGEDETAELLRRLDDGELGDVLPVLAFLAGRGVDVPEAELNETLRRAMLLLVAGGDPHRELRVDDRAVKAVAADLFTEERRRVLGTGVDELATMARELPRVRDAAVFLAADTALAWRLYALALVAESLAE
jgi:hypothetical protein